MNEQKIKWLSTGYLKAKPSGKIDKETGVIEGVKVCTAGEAKGHGVFLDEEFIDTVVKFGNEKKQGLKARFGHPNMCSTALGTFLGRHKNFRKETTQRDDGQKAFTAVADLFLSNEAKDTPNGNLFDYVLGLAANEPDMFGESIVFTPGREYRKTKDGKNAYIVWQRDEKGRRVYDSTGRAMCHYVDKDGKIIEPKENELSEETYVECAELHASDCVDDPAANEGLFSRFSQETIAGQITEFLDLNPNVFEAIEKNPGIVEALAKYGDKVDGFINRYRSYREQIKKGDTMSDKTNSEQLKNGKTAESVAGNGAASQEKQDGKVAAEAAKKPEVDPAETVKAEYEKKIEALNKEKTDSAAKLAAIEKEKSEALSQLEEAKTKLAAFESGVKPVSAKAAKEGDGISAWKKAQKASRK